MSEGSDLVRAWRERRKAKGLKSVLIWLTPAEKHLLEVAAVTHSEDFGRVVARLLRHPQQAPLAITTRLLPTPPSTSSPARRRLTANQHAIIQAILTQGNHPSTPIEVQAALGLDTAPRLRKMADAGLLTRLGNGRFVVAPPYTTVERPQALTAAEEGEIREETQEQE